MPANTRAKIAVTGCAAQIEPALFAAMPEVAHVIGNAEKTRADTWATLSRAPRVRVGPTDSLRGARAFAVDAIAGQTRAFLEVQNGCDHRCTFCVIPFGRGNSRSLSPDEVIAQVRRVTEAGHREVVLTGVDITSYRPSLGALVKRILKETPALERLRLSSIDSVEADADLLDAFANDARLMPHLHLSLQHGDDLILKRMKRRHSREEALGVVSKLRALRPDMVFGADIIAGFPTETDEMFDNTLRIVTEADLTYLHVFPFSPRVCC